MCALVLLVLLADAAPAVAGDAATELEWRQLQHDFGLVPRAQSLADLDAFVARHPNGDAGARALVWEGDLALRDRRDRDAKRAYEAARKRVPKGEIHAFALRGLGDVAATEDHFTASIPLYEAALVDAPPVLAIELKQKIALGFQNRRRFGMEVTAWALLGVALAYFCGRVVTHKNSLRFPIESRFLLPIYFLLVLCSARDSGVRNALTIISLGSFVLVTIAFLPSLRRRIAVDVTLLTLANFALFYIAIRRAGIVDVLWTTIKIGADVN